MTLSWLLNIARFFLRSRTEQAALDLADELEPFGAYIAKYPRLAQLEAAGQAFAALAFPEAQASVEEAPAPAPDDPAPTRPQTPTEFNEWQAEHPAE